MSNQEILDNAPEGATHVDNFELYWMIQDRDSFNWQGQVNGWLSMSSDTDEFRSLEDIKRIAELEKIISLDVKLTELAVKKRIAGNKKQWEQAKGDTI